MDNSSFENRKRDHIQWALDKESQSLTPTDWESITLIPESLPDLNFSDIQINVNSLGQSLRSPYFVSSMTAGHKDSLKINSILAEACQEMGWLLGVGSQRRELTDPEAFKEWYSLRKTYPQVQLASNIGISQLIQTQPDQILKLTQDTHAVALFVHLNPLQECLQLEGTPQFKGGHQALETISKILSIPVILKEVGSGITASSLQRLKETGVAGIDVSGRGGTHWGRVEGLRAPENSPQALASKVFKDWGISTPRALYEISQLNPLDLEIWASGGIRDGLQAAKCLSLGSTRIGLAQPILMQALRGFEPLIEYMKQLEYELKVCLFCMGIQNISELRERKVWKWEKD